MAENASSTAKTPIETNSDLIAEVQSMVDNLPEAGGDGGGGINYGKPWVRPSNFPNYDYVDRTNEEALYLTYDCTVAKAFPDVPQYASFSIQGGAYTVEQGYVDNTGFHAESVNQYIVNSGVKQTLPSSTSDKDFVVFRITPQDGNHITVFSFDAYSLPKSFLLQPCVEAWGNLPNLTQWGRNFSWSNGATRWIESIDVITANAVVYSGESATSLRNLVLKVGNAISCRQHLANCVSLVTFDVSGWDLSITTSLALTFQGCTLLTSLDFSNLNTVNLTNLQQTFDGCASLTHLNLSGWNTSKVTTLRRTFANTALVNLNISGWDTSSVTDMNSTFTGCDVTALDLSEWDTSSVTNTESMFGNCTILSTLNLTGWVLNANTSVRTMFGGCSTLTDFYPGTFYVSYSLSDSPNLSLDSLARIITALPMVTSSQTLTLHATAKAKLTEEQIATANTKGWTIA